MSSRVPPPEPDSPRHLAPQGTPTPPKRIWVVGALAGLLVLALLLSVFSVWMILRGPG